MLSNYNDYFENTTMVEYYDWYDGPLFYLMEFKGKKFACYLIDNRDLYTEEYVIPLDEEGIADMKSSNIREWIWRQFSQDNLYIHKYHNRVGGSEYTYHKVTDIALCDDGFPSIDFTID